jgi:hypothetical protein
MLNQIKFRQCCTRSGKYIFEPLNEEAFETVEFLKLEFGEIGEHKFDKIYDWLTKLGHDVIIFEDRNE